MADASILPVAEQVQGNDRRYNQSHPLGPSPRRTPAFDRPQCLASYFIPSWAGYQLDETEDVENRYEIGIDARWMCARAIYIAYYDQFVTCRRQDIGDNVSQLIEEMAKRRS